MAIIWKTFFKMMKNEIKQQLPANIENNQLLSKIWGINKANILLYELQLQRNKYNIHNV